jgi:hypothetical protein
MKIGYSVEGSTDRAFLHGLRCRWCPDAELIEGRFRGTTRASRFREIPQICLELQAKEADAIVMLTDSNDDDQTAWRKVRQSEQDRVPESFRHLVVVGVCQRNVECWLCADGSWMAQRTGRLAKDFAVPDPKGAFSSAIGISGFEKRECEISALVVDAPLRSWLKNKSFEAFFDDLWQKSKELGCQIENLRDKPE